MFSEESPIRSNQNLLVGIAWRENKRLTLITRDGYG